MYSSPLLYPAREKWYEEMAEFKKQIGVGVAISVAAAIIVGSIALNVFPLNPAPTTTTTSGGFGTPPKNVTGGFSPGFYV